MGYIRQTVAYHHPQITQLAYRYASPSINQLAYHSHVHPRAAEHTGVGLRICIVWRTNNCGLWRIIIMRVGCIAMARVTLNMVTDIEASRVEWRLEVGGGDAWGFRHRNAG